MTANESLRLSLQVKDLLHTDLSGAFLSHLPLERLEIHARTANPHCRDRVFTPSNTILTMLLSATQEDKSQQNAVNMFKSALELRRQSAVLAESELLQAARLKASSSPRKPGRPGKYQSRLPKSYCSELSDSTAAYSKSRKKLDASLFRMVYEHSADFGSLDRESWHGMKTYITDGTYLQLQDTPDIKSRYASGQGSSYPQGLLQAFVRQGSGQISQYCLGSRQQSELELVVPMIKNLEKGSLLLADDLYSTYYHFCLVRSRGSHIIVPGKRARKCEAVRQLGEGDQIVEIPRTKCPDYVGEEEWASLPDSMRMRRIEYAYPTKNGMEQAVLYTTITDEKIKASEIIAKYAMRWDIEISIREIKTIMDISVLRSKSAEMLGKELSMALAAYNLVRKLIAESADKIGFPPQGDIFQKCGPFGRGLLLDKRGRVFFKWSPGRLGRADEADWKAEGRGQERKAKALPKENKAGQIQKI